MKIYNETKTEEIENPNLELGYLKKDKILIKSHPKIAEVQEQSHYITINNYPNGGKDIKKVIDVEYQPQKEAWDEFEDINIFIPYTDSELKSIRISKLKSQLTELNYDLLQDQAGLIVPNLDEKKQQFISLHNELRTLLNKTIREKK